MSLLCEGIRGLWGSHRRRWAAISLLAVGATLGVAGSSTGATRASQLDPSFGTGGIVQTDFSSNADVARGLVEQRDGKLVTAGVATQVVGTVTNQDFGLARYNPDGTLDSTFGSGGKVSTDVTGERLAEAFPVVPQPDG